MLWAAIRRRGRYIRWICIGREYAVAGKRAPTRTSLWGRACSGRQFDEEAGTSAGYVLAGNMLSRASALLQDFTVGASCSERQCDEEAGTSAGYALAGNMLSRASALLQDFAVGASLLWAAIRRRRRQIHNICIVGNTLSATLTSPETCPPAPANDCLTWRARRWRPRSGRWPLRFVPRCCARSGRCG